MEDSSASPDVAISLPMGRAPDEIGVRVHQALDGVGGNQKEQLREEVRHLLGRESAQLVEQVRAGASGLEVAHQRASFYSALLGEVWQRAGGEGAGENLVLGAVGGFGRGEMSPASDLDLVFFREDSKAGVAEEVVKQVLYVLWDLGFKVGHACRTIGETVEDRKSVV